MRIAVIGSGISSLCAAYYLRGQHDVTVFEAGAYVGGHTNTIELETVRGPLAIDTGFIVFNERTYPNFCRLLNELGVESQVSDMSFSVRCERTGLEYAGTGLNGLFAQRMNLLRPGFWRLLRDWRRFSRDALALMNSPEDHLTVGDFFRQHSYSREFREQYFLPMGSAVWSCPHAVFENFPLRFLIEFYQNHGLLTLSDPPVWRVVRGGSHTYVRAIQRALPTPIKVNTPVRAIVREAAGVCLHFDDGRSEVFDHVIAGCHADQSLRLLGERATPRERQILGAFTYESNTAVLHTDTSLLPRLRRAWASWNYYVPAESAAHATVTYHMNRLQGLKTPEEYCVSLNQEARIDPRKVLRSISYRHPIFSLATKPAQQRHQEVIDHEGVSYCGAYWGNGFHEDGVNSALAVCQALQARYAAKELSAA
ncbi:NAD(P)/FAD-dependent oxidoreductase [Anatilimnocola floriformis]|uniref:NAD(P)/FAD-dependent oxidoreductase n=1 Tax=Anatilimnocola floriformis TaxID=2948575 RepID=UPI0020C559F9|nr:FAD-dependent oxidoreductase [Anatilimnocola floriformis]